VLFNSVEFLIFFAVVFTAFWLARGRELRIWLLLAASYYFYMSWNAKLAAVVACSSLVDFLVAQALEDSATERKRKVLLLASIVMNLGLLFYFKYANFFLESLHELLAGLGIHQRIPLLDVVLPIGISFYTFEAISYTVDVYWRRVQAERNPIHFLLFITFFPRMVAGPIIRAKNFLPQLMRARKFRWARLELGLQYVLMGLFKKMLIADRMACLVDPVFQNPVRYSTAGVWVAMFAYSLQVYCDFSGYSDIAIGTAHMLGFKLPENFNMPYVSRNITEFWRRWHISLSTWLRDYVFISMGGSRGTHLRTMFTLMMTFSLCGLWHGAKWTFVIWGVMQGVMIVSQRGFTGFCKLRPGLEAWMQTGIGVALRIAVTFSAVTLGWVVFRSQDFATIYEVYLRMFTLQRGAMVRSPVGPGSLTIALVLVAICHLLVARGVWKKIACRLPSPVWGLAYAVLAFLICELGLGNRQTFIYFQF